METLAATAHPATTMSTMPPADSDPSPLRPILSRDEMLGLCKDVFSWSAGDNKHIDIQHQVIGVTRVNPLRTLASIDQEWVDINISTKFGGKASARIGINQIEESTLRQVVAWLDDQARRQPGPLVNVMEGLTTLGERTFEPVDLWHSDTVAALDTERTAKLSTMLEAVDAAGLHAGTFIGVSARACAVMDSDGLVTFGEDTDSEVVVTAWSPTGQASGWSGQAARKWTTIDPVRVALEAIDIAKRSADVQGLEPGRRVVVLGPAAVAQLIRTMSYAFSANQTQSARSTPFSKPPDDTRVGDRVFDERINMRSHPNDPEGGFWPFFAPPSPGFPAQPMEWVREGVLRNLQYDLTYKPGIAANALSLLPASVRMESAKETSTIDEMIASCRSGVYIQRLTGVDVVDRPSGLMTGFTNGGCFLIKDGKLDRAVKNFRFLDSPFFSLNSLDMIGASHRASLGFMPSGSNRWPLDPIIVPALKVRDFNLAMLAEAI